MADPLRLNSIKIDSEYLKPGNFLLIILILVTGGVGLISLFVYILEQRKIPILYFDRVWKQESSQSRTVYFLKIKRENGNGKAEEGHFLSFRCPSKSWIS